MQGCVAGPGRFLATPATGASRVSLAQRGELATDMVPLSCPCVLPGCQVPEDCICQLDYNMHNAQVSSECICSDKGISLTWLWSSLKFVEGDGIDRDFTVGCFADALDVATRAGMPLLDGLEGYHAT
jgi:hypothetical protein